jgi:hypothetical protein
MRGGVPEGSAAVLPPESATLVGNGMRRGYSGRTRADIVPALCDGDRDRNRDGRRRLHLLPQGPRRRSAGRLRPREPNALRGLAAVPGADPGSCCGVRPSRLGPLGSAIAGRVRLLDERAGPIREAVPAAHGCRSALARGARLGRGRPDRGAGRPGEDSPAGDRQCRSAAPRLPLASHGADLEDAWPGRALEQTVDEVGPGRRVAGVARRPKPPRPRLRGHDLGAARPRHTDRGATPLPLRRPGPPGCGGRAARIDCGAQPGRLGLQRPLSALEVRSRLRRAATECGSL